MGALRHKPTEKRLLDRANQQLGLLRHADLVALGLERNAIRSRRESCRLNRVHDDVYAFGHTALREDARWLAALWACGDEDALSHFTGGAFHRWKLPTPDDAIHVSTTASTTSRAGITVHRVKALDARDVFCAGPFRVTTIPRTLLDLADVLAWDDFRALADDQRSLDLRALRAAQERAGVRVGRGRVTRLIEADDAHTKSEFERRFLRFTRAHGLPRPDELNVRVAGHKADCVYRAGRALVVELDGRAFHERRAQMRADRRRDVDYQLAGCLVMRLVWDDLHADAAARTAQSVRQMLAIAAA